MVADVTAELAQLLDGSQVTLTPDQIQGDIDGGGKVLVCQGDLPLGCAIRGARAVVIDGSVVGAPNALVEIQGAKTVVVLGELTRAHVHSERVITTGSVSNSLLFAVLSVDVVGDLENSQIQLGPSKERIIGLLNKHASVTENIPKHNELDQEIEAARRELSRLLQVTGVVFNLNIGKIVTQTEDGLRIDLSTFYEAVAGRSEEMVDQALKQFFAKAVLGLLTRLNRDYIASGRGHQDRFKKVVKKLQDLMFKCREYDKFVDRYQSDSVQVETLKTQYAVTIPTLTVQGKVRPSVEVVYHGVSGVKKPRLSAFRLEIEAGRRKGTDEVKSYEDDQVNDMVVVSEASLEKVTLRVVGKKIRWEPHS